MSIEDKFSLEEKLRYSLKIGARDLEESGLNSNLFYTQEEVDKLVEDAVEALKDDIDNFMRYR